MIVRLPVASFNITDENGANFVQWYTQWSIRMPRSWQSSMRNENARESDNDPINSQSQLNCRKTVQMFDALPPRCHRPLIDLRKKKRKISKKKSLDSLNHSKEIQFDKNLRSESSAGNSFEIWIISKTHMPTHKMNLFSPLPLSSSLLIIFYHVWMSIWERKNSLCADGEECESSSLFFLYFYEPPIRHIEQHLINCSNASECQCILLVCCYQTSTHISFCRLKWVWQRQPYHTMLMIISLIIRYGACFAKQNYIHIKMHIWWSYRQHHYHDVIHTFTHWYASLVRVTDCPCVG